VRLIASSEEAGGAIRRRPAGLNPEKKNIEVKKELSFKLAV
jgi:hypothetical protein